MTYNQFLTKIATERNIDTSEMMQFDHQSAAGIYLNNPLCIPGADFEDIRFHFQFDKHGKATNFTITDMRPQPEKFVVVPREVVYPRAITLPVSQLANYVKTYKRQGSGVGFRSVEIVLEQNALWLLDDHGRHKFQPGSETEFFDEFSTGVHLHFHLDEKGQATALSIKGLGPELDNEIFVVEI
jgi:hypothetical protein